MPSWVSNRSIATKIVGIAMLVASIFAGIAVYGLVNLREVAAQQEAQYRRDVVAMTHMVAVRSAVGLQMEAVQSHLLSQPGFYRDRYEAEIADTDTQIDEHFTELATIELTKAELRELELLEKVIGQYRTARDTGLAASRRGDKDNAVSIVLVRSESVAHAVKARADEFLQQLVDAVATGSRQIRERTASTSRNVTILLIVGGIVAAGVAVLAARQLSRPLRRAVSVLTAVAAGDFHQRLEQHSQDEVGQMSRSLNNTVGVLRDAFDQLNHRAYHDGLTGLPNRVLLRERTERALLAAGPSAPVALLLIDLDGFKQVNDVHGHAAGDHLLVAVADRLRDLVRGADTPARLGGDEFAVLLAGAEDPCTVAGRVLAALRLPVTFGAVQLVPQASIGVAEWRGQADVDAFFHDADQAMYAAKAGGKGRVAVSDCAPGPVLTA
ncbi:diguanylate cyclase [Dactylosporangium vinaceum]|uniref:Diguanylate cyclase domain-containing protein n=1 Tax=Dactylosporangium vinaceum TaxID=53362 RepID=A0ABV5MG37_9ACTN|nr:diguanylate cyclase [Dactylosporangium vinaceum]UAB98933.1 diguanylate cyclase [Dactylosporangium vinaceum]